MATFFETLTIGDLKLKNRIVMAPMTRARANDEGVQPPFAADYYAQRASAGLLITEATNISSLAKGYARTPGIYTNDQIDAWRHVADAVHSKGGAIFMQIFHTGRIALPEYLPDNQPPVSASNVRAAGQSFTDHGMKDFVEPRSLTTEEIRQTVDDFATAAKNGISAGFDGVELHAANGYLVHQFLGTNTNLRVDEYGGTDAKRARFLLEVVDAICDAIGSDRLGVKLSPNVPFNDMQDANAEELYPFILRELNKRDLAYLHIGFEETPLTNVDWHATLRPLFDGVYFANGGFTKDSGADALARNNVDAVVYGKLFLANPDLPERFQHNAKLNEPDVATFYSNTGEKGYTDYSTMDRASAA